MKHDDLFSKNKNKSNGRHCSCDLRFKGLNEYFQDANLFKPDSSRKHTYKILTPLNPTFI